MGLSAGLLVYRPRPRGAEFLLAHPGGPYWRRRDFGSWTIPKGQPEPGEPLSSAALREFLEETHLLLPPCPREALAPVRTASGKVIHCWLVEADLDLADFRSNAFTLEWPPRSGKLAVFPEIDRIAYLTRSEALDRIHVGQRPFLIEAFQRTDIAATCESGGETRPAR